mgnify:CR=1 FL=1
MISGRFGASAFAVGQVDRTDEDGKVRFVLAHEDTGHANWLNLLGIEQGYALMRFMDCSEKTKPQMEKVLLSELSAALPKFVRKVTAAQRQEAIRAISNSRQLRRNW